MLYLKSYFNLVINLNSHLLKMLLLIYTTIN